MGLLIYPLLIAGLIYYSVISLAVAIAVSISLWLLWRAWSLAEASIYYLVTRRLGRRHAPLAEDARAITVQAHFILMQRYTANTRYWWGRTKALTIAVIVLYTPALYAWLYIQNPLPGAMDIVFAVALYFMAPVMFAYASIGVAWLVVMGAWTLWAERAIVGPTRRQLAREERLMDRHLRPHAPYRNH